MIGRPRITPLMFTCKVCGKIFPNRWSLREPKYCSLACRSKSSEWRKNISDHHTYLKGEKNPKTIWCKFSESEARRLFEDYKKSNQDIFTWAKTQGTSYAIIRKVFLRYFPHEYDDFIELKMDKKTSSYARGRMFEWRVRDYFKENKYFVLRSPQSAGPVDLVALRKGEILLIQCKVNGKLSRQETIVLKELAGSVGGKALLISRDRAPKYALIIEEI